MAKTNGNGARADMPKIAITGIGMITSLGEGREANWQALTAGKSGIHRITRFPIDGLRTTIAGSVDFIEVDPYSAPALSETLANKAIGEAVDQSGIGEPGAFPGPLFIAVPPVELEWPQREMLTRKSGITDNQGYAPLIEMGKGRTDLYELFNYRGVAKRIADEFGTQGSPISLSTACASGATAIQLGAEAIRRGETDAALTVGTDGSIHAEALIRFSLLSALSTNNEVPEKAARPFSKDRDGFVMAEGAAALVLENLESAKARGAEILAILEGFGERADTFHRTRSNPDGAAIIGAMQNALDDAGINPDDVDYINAHGTGTPENDKMECLGVTAVFGERDDLAISSNKSMIGHTLTAAGAIEAAFTVMTIREGLIPPTINYDEPDPAIEIDVVPNTARKAKVRRAMSNSFGFGGQNVCLVIGGADA